MKKFSYIVIILVFMLLSCNTSVTNSEQINEDTIITVVDSTLVDSIVIDGNLDTIK